MGARRHRHTTAALSAVSLVTVLSVALALAAAASGCEGKGEAASADYACEEHAAGAGDPGKADCDKADCDKADWDKADCDKANCDKADCDKADCDKADCDKADCGGAKRSGAEGEPACGEEAAAAAPAATVAGDPGTASPAAAAVALDGQSFGAGVTQAESVDIKVLMADVDKYVGKEIRVEGLVTGVCPKRGCWFDLAGDEPGEALRFKVTDGVMVFPVEDKGKYAVAQGVVRKIPMTLEQSKSYARHQRDSYGADMDPDAITEPLTIVRLDGTGAVIRDKK